MKKKLLVMLVAVMCILLCACGSSEGNNTENNQSNNESNTEEQGFSIVGEWKMLSNGVTFTFKEDGTFDSDFGTGCKYEVDLESNVVRIQFSGLGLGGENLADFELIQEDGIYKMQANNMCIVPSSEYDRLLAE